MYCNEYINFAQITIVFPKKFFNFEKFSILTILKIDTMFTPEDLALLKQKGISEKHIEEQLHCF